MANLRCFSHKCCYTISCYLASFCLILAPALYISGGITYSQDRRAKNIHEPNLCSVISSSYHEARCSGFRSTYRCFRPVWLVIHRIFEDDVVENRINATIEHDGFRSAADAEDKQNQYLVSTCHTMNVRARFTFGNAKIGWNNRKICSHFYNVPRLADIIFHSLSLSLIIMCVCFFF